jgi:hypothetical protein
MHGPINVKFPNNISKWQMGFNLAFKGLIMNLGLPLGLAFFGCLILKLKATPLYLAFLVILLVTGTIGGDGDDTEDTPNRS